MAVLSAIVGIMTALAGFAIWQLYRLYQLDKTCRENILVEIMTSTRSLFRLISWDGSQNTIDIVNPSDGTTKTWTVDETCIKTTSYPISGRFSFFKRDISKVILDAEDWEPVYSSKHKNGEIVASPRLLGTLINERVTAAIVGMGKEFTDAIRSIKKTITPTQFWIAMLVVIALLIVVISRSFTGNLTEVINKLDLIIKLLGG